MPVIYMDNAATSWPKPKAMLQAMQQFTEEYGANPGRSGHRMSLAAARVINDTREEIASLFGIKNPLRIIFTLNVTEALNLILHGLLKPGDHVITGSMEHNSVARPLRELENRGVEVTVIKCSPKGQLTPDKVKKSFKKNTRLVILTHASNVAGTLTPIKEIGRITGEAGILFAVDAAQTAGACQLNVKDMKIDLLAFTGHKSLLGPQGTGGLYIAAGVNLAPLKFGGTGSRSELDLQPEFLPDRYESGTPNTIGLAGLGASVKFVRETGVDNIYRHERALTEQLLQELAGIKNLLVYGPNDASMQMPVISINIEGRDPAEIGLLLDEKYGILTRVGLHCAPWAHKTINTFPAGTVRLSPGYFTTAADIDYTVRALREIAGG
ncbi:cysteine desulfurase family protein [Desulfofarcimen acetoxidans DSM 771]|uniref:cysteine desulfurase n=1 Tax=Desulfofarcimen acetoxidans (strain ATCC 49208 / DSM 771 / KCTC 5769 / VKM B-1644 / 5575) TaxID=485916 RepID=C8W3P1_DESAS|nr:cysteine desulfurase family protein [Desulfofarcimen acetoxidans DSM 771]